MSEDSDELISGVKGKLGELKGLGALLRFGYSVYTPVVDTGIDCLVDVGKGNYKEIQVKYREDSGLFQAKEFQSRDSFYVMCYLSTRYGETFWVIPSKVFSQRATHNKGYARLHIGKEGSESYEALRNYRENLHQLLTGATKETRQTVSTVRRRIKEQHFTKPELRKWICSLLAITNVPKSRKQIVNWLFNQLQGQLKEADLQRIKSGQPRWEKNARWAITSLKQEGMIRDVAKNQYVLTEKGRRFVMQITPVIPNLKASEP
jgi:predicted transcriptional regulator